MHALDGCGIAGNAAQNIFARTIGNILVHPQLGPLLGEQENRDPRRGKSKGGSRKKRISPRSSISQ